MGTRLVRTDKNGTQYWEDDRCPKCNGTGYLSCYAYHDGGVCYQCMGSGFGHTSWKVHTPEYQVKLDERRKAKEERDRAKFEENIAEYHKDLGLAENGLCYIVMGKTFGKKEELKAAGGRFNGSWWYLDHPDATWDTEEYDPKNLIWKNYKKKRLEWNRSPDVLGELKWVTDAIYKARREAANASVASEFYGAVGDKVNLEVTLEHTFSFASTDWRGEDTTKYGFKMVDDEGHHFVWITETNQAWNLYSEATGDPDPKYSEVEKGVLGLRIILKGTIKGHQERENLKETTLTRCRLKPVKTRSHEEFLAAQQAAAPAGTFDMNIINELMEA